MLKKLCNECTFDLTITPIDPVLIKSGYATVRGPDMTPVTTWRNGEEEVFLPGSSLKGVFRSHAERVARTIQEGIVCIPYLDVRDVQNKHGKIAAEKYADVFCGNKFRRRLRQQPRDKPKLKSFPSEIAYSDSCPVCRLFGSTEFIGRISISDAYLQKENPSIERRDGVGIDRFTGGAAHGAKFELEVVSNGMFKTAVRLRNFEIWQLGMIAVLIKDFQDDLIQIGSGKSRGLGRVHGEVCNFKIAFFTSPKKDAEGAIPEDQIWGLGKFLEQAQERRYGTKADNVLHLDTPMETQIDGIRTILPLEGEILEDVLNKATKTFVEVMKVWDVPQDMRHT